MRIVDVSVAKCIFHFACERVPLHLASVCVRIASEEEFIVIMYFFYLALSLLVGHSLADGPQELLGDYYDWKRSQNPHYASLLGSHDGDHRLPDVSPGAARSAAAECRRFSRRAEDLLPLGDAEEAFYVQMVKWECDNFAEGVDLGGHYFANVVFMLGLHTDLPTWFGAKGFFSSALGGLEGNITALSRLSKVAAVFEGIRAALEEGAEKNITLSEASLRGVDEQFNLTTILKPEETSFFKPFQGLEDDPDVPEEAAVAVTDAAKAIIEHSALASMRDLQSYLKDEYSNRTRPSLGLVSLPDGDKMYEACLVHHITISNVTAEEVHQIGLADVAELKETALKLAEELGYPNMTLKQVAEAIRAREDQQFEDGSAMVDYLRQILKDKVLPVTDQILPEEFLNERVPAIEVKPFPPGLEGIAFYYQSNPEGTRNGTFFVNANEPLIFAKFQLMNLLLHETIPGHHLDLTGRKLVFTASS